MQRRNSPISMRSLTGHLSGNWLGGLSLLVVLTLVVGSGVELRALANSGTILERIAATAVTPQLVAIARRQLERPVVVGSSLTPTVDPHKVTVAAGLGRTVGRPVSHINVMHLDTPPPSAA